MNASKSQLASPGYRLEQLPQSGCFSSHCPVSFQLLEMKRAPFSPHLYFSGFASPTPFPALLERSSRRRQDAIVVPGRGLGEHPVEADIQFSSVGILDDQGRSLRHICLPWRLEEEKILA
jgi:hypothetical protein